MVIIILCGGCFGGWGGEKRPTYNAVMDHVQMKRFVRASSSPFNFKLCTLHFALGDSLSYATQKDYSYPRTKLKQWHHPLPCTI